MYVSLQLLRENTAIKRQSSVLLQSVAGDTRLMKALTEVEDLTAALETVKDDYQNEVWNLLTGLLGSADYTLVCGCLGVEQTTSILADDIHLC